MLSFEESVSFLSTINVSYNKEKRENDPVGFLNEIIYAFQLNIPFQSITLMAKPIHLRDRPTLEEIKEDVISKRGGLCYTLNTFMKNLLVALGYTANHVGGHIVQENNHIMTVVEILSNKYLVDVGVGYPTFEAIPLDFEKESQIYHHSFMKYKFVRDEGKPNFVIRMHKKSEHCQIISQNDIWRRVCIVDLTPRDFGFFDELMTLAFKHPASGYIPFHSSLRLVTFTEDGAKIIKDKSYLVENPATRELALNGELTSFSEVLDKIKELYPLLHDIASSGIYKPDSN